MCRLLSFLFWKNVAIILPFILIIIVKCENVSEKLDWYDCSEHPSTFTSHSHIINNCVPIIECLTSSDNKEFVAGNVVAGLSFSITLLTSHTKNIETYSSYSLLINQLYAHLHGYRFISILEAKYSANSVYDKDSRWNKIKYLSEQLETHNGSLNSNQYFIWLDADLAIVNYQFDFAKLVAFYPDAHIIMSRDKSDAPFVGNTGCIIVQDSQWSYDFLQLWWSSYDRNRCCDQNALTWLYDRNVPSDIHEKLVFLPANVLNTDFPAYVEDKRYLNFLHLAGVNSLFRRRVFRQGLVNVCTIINSSHDRTSPVAADYPALLGLDYHYLQAVVEDLDRARLCALNVLHDDIKSLPTTVNLAYLDDIRNSLNDILKYDDDEALFARFDSYRKQDFENRVFAINIWLNQQLFNLTKDISLECSMQNEECKLSLEVIREAVTSSFELVLSRPITADTSQDLLHTFYSTLNHARDLVEFVLGKVPEDIVQSRFLYYRFKSFQLLADITSYDADINVHINHLISAAAIWRDLTFKYRYYGTEYVLADPHKEFMELLVRLGVILCEHERQDEGIVAFQEAVTIQREMIRGYDVIRLATESIIKRGHLQLAEILFNLAVCATTSSSIRVVNSAEKKAWLEEVIAILEQIGAENDTMAYEQAKQMLNISSNQNPEQVIEIEGSKDSDKQYHNNKVNKRFRKKKVIY